jgi:hypothetical protein
LQDANAALEQNLAAQKDLVKDLNAARLRANEVTSIRGAFSFTFSSDLQEVQARLKVTEQLSTGLFVSSARI